MKEEDEKYDLYEHLDPGIRETVRILREHGIETTESCEGTPGHVYPDPTVCFCGAYAAGWRALGVCFDFGLRVKSLQRYWSCDTGEIVGPEWRITFYSKEGGLHPYDDSNGKLRWKWGTLNPPQDITQEGKE